MKRMLVLFSSLLWLFAAVDSFAASSHSLWYDQPAPDDMRGWEERSLPVGNGWFGVSVFGGVHAERLQVTEPTFLTRRNLTDALDIRLSFTYPPDVDGYRRGLDLETGLTWMEQTDGKCKFRREAFASYPARVFAYRISCSEKGKLNFSVSPEVPFQRQFGRGSEAYVGRTGHVTANGNVIDVVQHLQWYNVRFFGRILVETDGQVESLDHTLVVKDATEATLYFSCATNYRLRPESFGASAAEFSPETGEPKMRDEDEPSEAVKARVAAAAKKGYAALKAEHIADFGGLMRRVEIDLGEDAGDRAVPTDRLLADYAKGRASAYLEETYFQYGRYLLVSSSRPGTLPASLQGVWAAHDKSPWGSGYWHNINVQMNYWPAFNCNLAECFEAYAAFNAAFRPVTRQLVKAYLEKHGLGPMPDERESPDIWCVGTAVYPYTVRGYPGGHSGPGTGGFTTKCFKDWWDFTRDEKALRTYIWPTVHGMADFLTRCVKEEDGEWLSAFSASPEQWVKRPDGTSGHYQTVGCAFDQQMIHENGVDTLELAKALGVSDEVTKRIERQLGHYAPVLVGESGQIKEFREEKRYGDIGEYHHRHISQLVGLYPGSIINRNTPEWMAAAKVTLTERGDESTGWALAHRLNCWARLGDGDHCHGLIRNLLSKRTNANLWDMHPPFQIDGNFGATAGIAEMLLQSHAGSIDVLPALPKTWSKQGSFRGLCARGAYEVDCDWKDGKPVRVAVRAKKGGKPDVRFAGKPVQFDCSSASSTEVAEALEPFVRRGEIAGVVSVLSDPKYNVTADCFGWADVENRVPMSTDTVFAVFSMTKTLTACAIMVAVDRGILKMEDRVENYLPEFARLENKVTIRSCMCHVSGIMGGEVSMIHTSVPVREQARSWALNGKCVKKIGEAFSYGNIGIATAAACLEVAAGEPYERFLRENVLNPLGMKDTRFVPTEDMLRRLVKAYTTKGGPFQPAADKCSRQLEFPVNHKIYPMPAAGLYSTPADMIRFSQMLAHHGEWKGRTIVSRKTFDGIWARKQTPDNIGEPYTVGAWLFGDWFGHEGAMRTDQRANLKTGHSRVFFIQTENKAGQAFFDAKIGWHRACDRYQKMDVLFSDELVKAPENDKNTGAREYMK